MKRIRELWPFVRRYRWRLLAALAGTCLVTLLGTLPPLLYRYLFDRVVAPKAWQLLLPAVGAIVMAQVIALILQFVNTRLLMGAAYRLVKDLRLALYDRVLHLSMRYHGSLSAGAVTTRIMSDVSALQGLLTSSTIQIVVDVIIFVFSLSVAFTISPQLATILCLVLVLYVLAYRYFVRPIRSANIAYRRHIDRLAGRLQETIRGVRQVRIYNREDLEGQIFSEQTTLSQDRAFDSNMSSVGLSTTCSAISGYGSTVIAGLAAWYVLRGRLSYGDLWAMDHYVWMAITPAVRLATVAAQLAAVFVSVDRIVEVLCEETDVVGTNQPFPLDTARGSVTFNEVVFGYEPGKPLFDGLHLEVPPGATVALVGHTGCGKTTLTALLMRYWDVQGGAVLIDGIDVRSVSLKSLRQLFGVVLQDPVVFEGTLAENIAYGVPNASREQITQAAAAAEILDMAQALPNGFDTLLGSKGMKLSVGEKQRISIARAILRDPVILIMDEATSALDSQSEALIQTALTRVFRGRTSFVVAHRLSTIIEADMIVVMDNGRIVEQGPFDKLMAIPDGQFRTLYEQLRTGGREGTS